MLVKIAAGEYRTQDGGWGVTRTSPNGWLDHNTAYPWVVYRRFYGGGQPEARFRTFTAAKKWLVG